MLNKVILMGRLTAEPELKQTQGGISVTSFSLAVERNFADKDGKRATDFINIVAWRQTADFIRKYFSKGQMIALEGNIQTRSYEDKQGDKRTAFEVIAESVYFAEKKADKPANTTQAPQVQEPQATQKGGFEIGDFEEINTDDSDLPF